MTSIALEALPAQRNLASRSRTDWFMAARWGIMCHYLDSPASSEIASTTSSEDWNRRIDNFDVSGFTNQVERIGAGYVSFTTGQNSGHYCSPNATYDSIVGRYPSLCSRRDLIAELAASLARVGVKLIVYLPSGAPEFDPLAVERFEWRRGDYRLHQFQCRWESVVREWSDRWGTAIAGWWIDGCYFAEAMYRQPEPPNFMSFAAALRSGNPDSIIAFNAGVQTPVARLTEYEDYTAGEINADFPTANKWSTPARFIHDSQYHILSYLGDWWGEGAPRFSNEFVTGFTADVNSRQGVVTWDVPLSPTGQIDTAFIQQLKRINGAVGQR
jgi:hypothetical protein